MFHMMEIRFSPFTPTTMKYAAIIPGKDGHLVFNRNVTSSDFNKPGFFDANSFLGPRNRSIRLLKMRVK